MLDHLSLSVKCSWICCSRNFSSRPCEFCGSGSPWSLQLQEGGCESRNTGHLRGTYTNGPRTKTVFPNCHSLWFFFFNWSPFSNLSLFALILCRWNTSNPWTGYSPIEVAWTVNVDEVLNYIRKLLMKPWENIRHPGFWRWQTPVWSVEALYGLAITSWTYDNCLGTRGQLLFLTIILNSYGCVQKHSLAWCSTGNSI